MKLKDGLLINKIDDEYVLVDIGKVEPTFNGMIKLNETSKEIVDLLKVDTSEDKIVDALISKYQTPRKTIQKDVKEIINELKKVNLIVL